MIWSRTPTVLRIRSALAAVPLPALASETRLPLRSAKDLMLSLARVTQWIGEMVSAITARTFLAGGLPLNFPVEVTAL